MVTIRFVIQFSATALVQEIPLTRYGTFLHLFLSVFIYFIDVFRSVRVGCFFVGARNNNT